MTFDLTALNIPFAVAGDSWWAATHIALPVAAGVLVAMLAMAGETADKRNADKNRPKGPRRPGAAGPPMEGDFNDDDEDPAQPGTVAAC